MRWPREEGEIYAGPAGMGRIDFGGRDGKTWLSKQKSELARLASIDPKATVRNVESGPSTFGLKGAEKGGEAGCWSVPLEAIVSSVHLLNYMNLLAVCFSESEALHEG